MAHAAEKVRVNVRIHLMRGILGGIVAFVVFNAFVIYVSPKFLGEPLDIALAMIVLDVGFTAANVLRFLVGSLVFPLGYLAVFLPFVPLPSPLRGMVFGGLLWLLVGAVVTPWAGAGWFFGGVNQAGLTLISHLIYGAILGTMVGRPSRLKVPKIEQRKRVLILGGGFAGLYTALVLEKKLAHDPGVEVTLVNRENFFLFTPMLHEIAASDLDITNIVIATRQLLHHTQFIEGNVEAIDLENKRVVISHGLDPSSSHELPYDYLVLALGSVTNFFNTPGVAERALTMKSLGDAIILRNRMIECLEEADLERSVGDSRESLLTFVVAGGGFSGVETCAAMNDFLRESVKFYPNLTEDLIRVVLVHPRALILPELGPKLGAYAQKKLPERWVEILVNTKVKGMTDEGVELTDGTTIKANTLVWTAGTSPNPVLASLPCRMEHGRLLVNEFLEVPDWEGVWALGDCAMIPDPHTEGSYYPPTAQHALREGRVAAKNVMAAIRGGPQKPFIFSTIGQLAAIGRRTGVAKILGVKFSGFVAWFLWRTVYLSKLPRFEKKLRVMFDWTLDLIFSKDLVQFQTMPGRTINMHTIHDYGHHD